MTAEMKTEENTLHIFLQEMLQEILQEMLQLVVLVEEILLCTENVRKS